MAAAWRGLIVVTLLLAAFAFKGLLVEPPQRPLHVKAGEFDADRAAARLQRVLGDERAHPVDSEPDDQVRERLIAELQAMGLSTRVQDATDCSAMPKTRSVSCSRVRNIIATISSPRRGTPLLLNAHYDSTPTGPGAADDGVGVASLLEIGSILKAFPPQRPVVLLFNEGEEFGLNGAHAFVRSDPLAHEINSLINIDVRGVTGPALMYETSDPNRAAIKVYADAARRPYANSISTDFAKLIPNTTDVVFFKPLGWTLLNYGIIGNETRYHSPGDTVSALDRNSLAHVGSEVLSATRAMAAVPEPLLEGKGRMVFTDILGRGFLQLPLAAALAILVVCLLASAVLAVRENAIGKPLAIAAAMTLGGTATSAFIGFLLSLMRAGDFWRAHPLVAYLALYAVLLLVMSAIYWRLGRTVDRARMRSASWLLIMLIGSLLSIILPGATIFFLVAPAIALVGIAVSRRSPGLGRLLSILAVLIQFLMFAQLLALIEVLLVDGPLWAIAPLAALASLPAFAELDAAALRPSIAVLFLCSLGLSAAALAMPRASGDRPLGFSIDYFRDGTRTADWGIATKQAPLPPHFPGQWNTGVLPYNGRTRWLMRAPLLETRVASARLVASEQYGQGRRLRIALSTGGANSVSIRFPKEAHVLALGLPGAAVAIPPIGEPEKPSLRCTGRSCDGFQIEVVLDSRQPVEAELFSTSFGLPNEGRALIAARPRDAIPQYAPDQTITRSIVRL